MENQIQIICKCGAYGWFDIDFKDDIICTRCKRRYIIGKYGRVKETILSKITHLLRRR